MPILQVLSVLTYSYTLRSLALKLTYANSNTFAIVKPARTLAEKIMQFNCRISDTIINTELNFMSRTKRHESRMDKTATTYLINKSLISQPLENIDVVNVDVEEAGIIKTPTKSTLCDFILANNNDVYSKLS